MDNSAQKMKYILKMDQDSQRKGNEQYNGSISPDTWRFHNSKIHHLMEPGEEK
jgi:hypothetical protein